MTEKTETELFGNEKRFFELVKKAEPTIEDIQEINNLITEGDVDPNKITNTLVGAPAVVFLAQRLNIAIKNGNKDLESKFTEIIKIFLNSPKVDVNQQYKRDGKVYNIFVLLNEIIERYDSDINAIINLFKNDKKQIGNLKNSKILPKTSHTFYKYEHTFFKHTFDSVNTILDTLDRIEEMIKNLQNEKFGESIEEDKNLLEKYRQNLEGGESLDEKEYLENIEKITVRINNAKDIINKIEKEKKYMKEDDRIDPFIYPEEERKMREKIEKKIEKKIKEEIALHKIGEKKSALLELNILLDHVMSLAISKKNEKTEKSEDKTVVKPSAIKFKNRNRGNSLNLTNQTKVEQEPEKERPKSMEFSEKTTSSSDSDEKEDKKQKKQQEETEKKKQQQKKIKENQEEKQKIKEKQKEVKQFKKQQMKNKKAKNQTESKKLKNLDSELGEGLLSEVENSQLSFP